LTPRSLFQKRTPSGEGEKRPADHLRLVPKRFRWRADQGGEKTPKATESRMLWVGQKRRSQWLRKKRKRGLHCQNPARKKTVPISHLSQCWRRGECSGTGRKKKAPPSISRREWVVTGSKQEEQRLSSRPSGGEGKSRTMRRRVRPPGKEKLKTTRESVHQKKERARLEEEGKGMNNLRSQSFEKPKVCRARRAVSHAA